MANITIRNLDDEVVARLKARARANHRSLEAELRDLLSKASLADRPADLRSLVDRIAAMTPSVPQTNSADLLREDRDR